MRILPIIHQEIHSPYSAKILSERLKELTPPSGEGTLTGKVSEKSFSVYKKPAKYVRNSYLPIAVGDFHDTEEGCHVQIKVRMNFFSAIFTAIWSLGVLAVLIACLLAVLAQVMSSFYYLLIPILMLAMDALLIFIGFHLPARKLLDILICTFS